jgi:hypothetical protein
MPTQRIIFLNGSINAGKSTVAKILAQKLSRVAIVEIDLLHEMIKWMPIDKAVPINLENAVSIIRNFVGKGMDVVVPYPLSDRNYAYMVEALKDIDAEIHVFTLAPSLEKALSNRGDRKLDDAERNRIKYHYDVGINNPSFGEIIDNSELSPEETAQLILSKITKE